MSGVIESNNAYSELEQSVELFSSNIKTAQTEDSRSIVGFERKLNDMFSTCTILVEGTSEVGLINKLIDDGIIEDASCVFDCLGKYNVHRFMNLFGKLGIFHSVIIDIDRDNIRLAKN